jgi:ABC-type branched-subunit amino acid transport system substrate-binding protein
MDVPLRFPGPDNVDFARLSRAACFIVGVALLAASVFGCHKSHRKDKEDLAEKPPIEAKSEGAQKKFDEAKALLVAGEYDQAAQQFRLLQADHGDDPIADVAELYAARAALGDLSPSRFAADDAAAGDVSAARQQLESLASGKAVDDRVSYSARAYLAAAHAISGDRAGVRKTLKRYPGPSVSSVVLPVDRPLLLLLIADAMNAAERWEAVVEADASLFQVYAQHRPEETMADDDPEALEEPMPDDDPDSIFDANDIAQLAGWAQLARTRAFRVADEQLSDAQLQEFLATESSFLRAVSGWGLLRDMLEEGVTSDDARAAAEDLFNSISPDLVDIGAGNRAAELSTSLAAAGGPRRLAVGVVLPLTGKASGVGAKVMAGTLTAVRAFSANEEPSVTVVFQDSSKPAAEVFEAFSKQGVSAVVGPLDRKRAVEYAAAAESAGIPMMAMTAQSARELMKQAGSKPTDQADGSGNSKNDDPKATDDDEAERPFVFRNFVDPRAEARAAARLAFEDADDRRAAVIYPNIGYGRTMAKAFRTEFRELGGQIVLETEYDRSNSDFGSVAKQLANSDAQAVFIPDSASKVAELTAFFANANVWGYPIDEEPPTRSKRRHVHYVGTSLWQDPILIRQAGSYVEGAAVPSWFSSSFETEHVERFVRRFEAVYGRTPENFEAFAFDSVAWFIHLLRERGMSRPEALRDALLNTPEFVGVTGNTRFRPDGEAVRKLRFVTPSDEGFEPLPFTAQTESVEPDKDDESDGLSNNSDASSTDSDEGPAASGATAE